MTPDEFDFKNYDSIEDYSQSVEASSYYHDLYLKAVNHPIRRKILEIINQEESVSKQKLLDILKQQEIKIDGSILDYNLDYLMKALCIKVTYENEIDYYEITQSGKVIENLSEK